MRIKMEKMHIDAFFCGEGPIREDKNETTLKRMPVWGENDRKNWMFAAFLGILIVVN